MKSTFVQFLFAVGLSVSAVSCSTCGGHMKLYKGMTGSITSPNYPSSYRNMHLCIWLMEAPEWHGIVVWIDDVVLEATSDSTECLDFIEIREHNSTGDILLSKTCNIDSPIVVKSRGRFLWFRFKSNYVNVFKGFSSRFEVLKHSIQGNVSLPECSVSQYQCPNLQCIEMSQICNNVSECGCDSYKCDEGDYHCKSFEIDRTSYLVIVIVTPFTLFFVLIIVFGLVDSKSESKPCAKIMEQCSVICKSKEKEQIEEEEIDTDAVLQEMIEKLRRGEDLFSDISAANSSSPSRRTSMADMSSVSPSPYASKRNSYVHDDEFDPADSQRTRKVSVYGKTLMPSDAMRM